MVGARAWRRQAVFAWAGSCLAAGILATGAGATGLHWSAPVPIPNLDTLEGAGGANVPANDHVPRGLWAISCPSSSLCVGGGRLLMTSTNPAAGASSWQPVAAPTPAPTPPPQPPCAPPTEPTPNGYFCPAPEPVVIEPAPIETFDLQSLSCPSTSLCVAAGGTYGSRSSQLSNEVFTSTDPTGGSSAWQYAILPGKGGIRSISCTPTAVCVAITGANKILTTSNPTGGPGAWKSTDLYPYAPNAVACQPGLCVIAGEDGYVLAATNPLGGLGAWAGNQIGYQEPISGVACASRKLCVADDGFGEVLSSTRPARGNGHWRADWSARSSRTTTPLLSSGTCTPTGLCAIAGGEYGRSGVIRSGIIVTNTNPARHPRSWKQARVDSAPISAIACPTSTFCVAADRQGDILTASR